MDVVCYVNPQAPASLGLNLLISGLKAQIEYMKQLESSWKGKSPKKVSNCTYIFNTVRFPGIISYLRIMLIFLHFAIPSLRVQQRPTMKKWKRD